MNFSETIKGQNGLMCWSPCGYLLASVSGPRLTVWDASTLEVLQVYTSKETPDYLEFSPDSNFVLAANFKTAEVNIFSLNSNEWTGKLTEGLGGLAKVEWAQDSRHIITASEFFVKQTFWSLTNKSISYIRNPKQSSRLVYYNKDKTLGLVIERQNGFDTANILATQDWSLIRQFCLDTDELSGAVWSPLNNSFAVWDSPLRYRLLVYTHDGHLDFDYCAYEHQLGVKTVSYSPSGQLLIVGSHDGKIRILNTLCWSVVHEIEHYPALHEREPVTSRAVIYEETDLQLQDPDTALALELGGVVVQHTKYLVVDERPIYLDFCKIDPKKGGTVKVGVGLCVSSNCGRYLASKCDNLPTVCWIWDLDTLRLAAMLVHKNCIKNLNWDPTQPRLALVTGGAGLYFWTPAGCVIGRVPPVARGYMSGITDVTWNVRGRFLLLNNKESGVICRLHHKDKEKVEDIDNVDDDLDLEPSKERISPDIESSSN